MFWIELRARRRRRRQRTSRKFRWPRHHWLDFPEFLSLSRNHRVPLLTMTHTLFLSLCEWIQLCTWICERGWMYVLLPISLCTYVCVYVCPPTLLPMCEWIQLCTLMSERERVYVSPPTYVCMCVYMYLRMSSSYLPFLPMCLGTTKTGDLRRRNR